MTVLNSPDNLFGQEKARLIYVGDPLCSWCYGFSGEISEAVQILGADVEFELVMGGLRPYNKETMKDLGDFLHHHWDQVSKRSGKQFNYEILKDHSFVYDTEPPARAVLVVREMAAEKEFDFFKDVQTEFYLNNKNTNNVESYKDLATKHKLDWNDFVERFNSERLKETIRKDFRRSASLGVSGFPSVLIMHKGEIRVVCNGYTSAEMVVKNTNRILKELNAN